MKKCSPVDNVNLKIGEMVLVFEECLPRSQ